MGPFLGFNPFPESTAIPLFPELPELLASTGSRPFPGKHPLGSFHSLSSIEGRGVSRQLDVATLSGVAVHYPMVRPCTNPRRAHGAKHVHYRKRTCGTLTALRQGMTTKTLRSPEMAITETVDLSDTAVGAPKPIKLTVRADPMDARCTGRRLSGIIGTFAP